MPVTYSPDDVAPPPTTFKPEDVAPPVQTFGPDEVWPPIDNSWSAMPGKMKAAGAAVLQSLSGGGMVRPEDVPTGAEITKASGIPKAVTVPVSAVFKLGAGVMDFATSPKGIAQTLATDNPVTAPVIFTKWAYDMLKGGVDSLEDATQAIYQKIVEHSNSGKVKANDLPTPPPGTKDPQDFAQRLAEDAVNSAALLVGGFGTAGHGMKTAAELPTQLKAMTAKPTPTPRPAADELPVPPATFAPNEVLPPPTGQPAAAIVAPEAKGDVKVAAPPVKTPTTGQGSAENVPPVADMIPDFDPNDLGKRVKIQQLVDSGMSRDDAVQKVSDETTAVGKVVNALPSGSRVRNKQGMLFENVAMDGDAADWHEIRENGDWVPGSVAIGHNLRGGTIVRRGKAQTSAPTIEATDAGKGVQTPSLPPMQPGTTRINEANPQEGPSRILTQIINENLEAKAPIPASLVDQYNATAEVPFAMPEGYQLENGHWTYTEPEVELTEGQKMVRENLDAMAALRKAKAEEAAGGTPALPGEPPEGGTPDLTERPEAAAGADFAAERPPDVLDWVEQNFPGGVKTTSKADFGDYVKGSKGAARDLLSNASGTSADRVLQEMQAQGVYPRIQSEDDLLAAMQKAGSARAEWREPKQSDWLDNLDSLKADTNGQLHAFGLLPEAWNTLIDGIKLAVRGGLALKDAIDQAFAKLKGNPDFDAEGARAHLLKGETFNAQHSTPNTKMVDRQFNAQLQSSQDISDALKNEVTTTRYQRRPQEEDTAYAGRLIDQEGGAVPAMSLFRDKSNGLPSSVRMAVGMQILKRLDAGGRYADAARFFDEDFAQHTTDAGQGLAMLNAWSAMSADGKLFWAQKKIADARTDSMAPVKPNLEAARTELQELNRQGIEATTASPDVQTAARKANDAAVANSPEVHKAVVMDMAEPWASSPEIMDMARAQVRSKVDELLNRGSRPVGLTPAAHLKQMLDDVASRAASIAANHFQGAEPGVLLRDKFMRRLGLDQTHAEALARQLDKAWQSQLTAAKNALSKRIANQRAAQIAGKTFRGAAEGLTDKATPSAVDRAINAGLRVQQQKLGQIVHEHFSRQDKAGKDLTESLVKEAGLNELDAKDLADKINARFAERVREAKTAALNRLLKPVRQLGLAKPGMVDRLLKLTNLGAFDEKTFYDAVRERMNLPEWTPELRDQLKGLADKIAKIPEDRAEDLQRAQTDFMNALQRAKGISNLDLSLGFYVGNILSGLTTHARVAIHTSLQMVGATVAEMERALVSGRIQDIPLIYEALDRSTGKAIPQLKDIMRSGLVVGSKLQKVVPLSVLENIHFGEKGGTTFKQGRIAKAVLENRLATLLNLWKYNSRLITAQHMLYYKPAEEMKLALLASRQARETGLTGLAAVDRARQMLGYGADQVRAAEAQALTEGLTGARAKMRTAEILQQGLPKTMRETARDYALRQTFLNDPYGFAGAIADLVSKAKSSPNAKLASAARVIVPFARIAANLFNEGLNYTPVGALRAKLGKTELLGHKFADLTLEQQSDLRSELYAKSALGMMLFTGIAIKAAQDLSNPNPGFTLYGGGPANPDDKAAWRAGGGLQYSFKIGDRYISFANTPGNVFLAAFGNYLDGIRDAKLYHRTGAERLAQDMPMRAAAATIGAGKVIMEQPFLQSLLEVSQLAGDNNAEVSARGAVKVAARTASSFVVPNLLRQVDRLYDPTAYQQRDVSGILTSQVPFVRQQGRPLLNALGQPIQSPVFGLFTSTRPDDKLTQLLVDHNAWPAVPDRNRTLVNGVPLTDDEYYRYCQVRGEALREMLSRPTFAPALDRVQTAADRLKTQADQTSHPVAKANLEKTAQGLVHTQLLDAYTAAANAKASAAVIRERGY